MAGAAGAVSDGASPGAAVKGNGLSVAGDLRNHAGELGAPAGGAAEIPYDFRCNPCQCGGAFYLAGNAGVNAIA